MRAIVKQRLALTTEEGTNLLVPSPHPQVIPPHLESHSYLALAIHSGHVEVITVSQPHPPASEAVVPAQRRKTMPQKG